MYHPELNLHPLPERLLPLMEQLAQKVHDTWAAGRLSEGWQWGPELDHSKMTHPSLIPYEALSEAEKDYDRRTATQTILFLLEQGYRIDKE